MTLVTCSEWEEKEGFHLLIRRSPNGELHLAAEIQPIAEPRPHFEWAVFDFFDSDRIFACGDCLSFEQARVLAEANMEECQRIGHTSNR